MNMEEKKNQSKLGEMWQNLKDGMFFTRRPGCPYCADLQLDDEGKPLVKHPTVHSDGE